MGDGRCGRWCITSPTATSTPTAGFGWRSPRTTTVKPYEEQLWADLPDGATAPLGLSLAMIDALNARLSMLLHTLTPERCARPFVHPTSGPHDVDWLLAIYAWHGPHHIAHITALREAKGW